MVVRDLAVDMVEYMSLRNTVCCACTNPTHQATQVTKQATVESCQSATGERELRRAVVGKNGVSVLKERDENEPVVNPVTGVSSIHPTSRNRVHTKDMGQGRRGAC